MAALLFQSTNDNLVQNTESNLPIFASLRTTIRTRSTYFVATIIITQCVSLRYPSTPFTACCLFQTEKGYHGKTESMPFSQVSALGSCKLFIRSYVLYFFCIFYFLRWTLTLRSKFRRFCAFACILNVYDNCIIIGIIVPPFFGSPLPLP